MPCTLNLEYCTRSCGCANCPYNESKLPEYVGTKEWIYQNNEIKKETENNRNSKQSYFFENIIPKCVKPLLNVDGVGFFIKNYFITAGHSLAEDGYIKINHQGQEMIFHQKDAVILHTIDCESEEEQLGDIAIFRCVVGAPYLQIGMEPDEFHYTIFDKSLWIASYEHKSINNSSVSNSPLLSPPIEIRELTISKAKDPSLLLIKSDNSYHSNFFEVTTEKMYGPGASGSPIFNEDNEVIGLLVGCRNPIESPNIILFHPLYRYLYNLDGLAEESDY